MPAIQVPDTPASSRRLALLVAIVFVVAAVVRLAGLEPQPAVWLAATAGALTAALIAVVGAMVAGSRAALWAGLLVALSPIHALASREATPAPFLVLCVALSLVLALLVEAGAGLPVAVAHGLVLGILGASGVAGPAALAALQFAWLAGRDDRRRAFAASALVALLVLGVTAALGLLRSPLAPIQAAGWIPPTSLSRLVRCSGASFTRVIGLEYQVVVHHARYFALVTLMIAGLAAFGALHASRRIRWLLVAGAVLPFVLAAVLALSSGRVTPLQAARLVPALPFLATLEGAGLVALERRRAVLLGAGLLAVLGTFLALVLAGR